ncbi:MAG: SPOR domain-containing protein [Bacteroidales bacterium]|nr:SPOR domain-containing protein [Bacteroidales bacterium]
MNRTVILIMAVIMIMAGCRSKRMTEVDSPRTIMEQDTGVSVEVDSDTRIRAVEERFTFTREEDESVHDAREFFVIIGSFREKANADRYTAEMRLKGFNPVILLSETGFHRVSVDSYLLEADARRRILQIKSDFPEHDDTWLLIRK